jgi:hypothetical protein
MILKFFTSGGFSLPAQPRTWRTRALLFPWVLPLRFSDKEELTSSYATASVAFAVFIVHYVKVGIPLRS